MLFCSICSCFNVFFMPNPAAFLCSLTAIKRAYFSLKEKYRVPLAAKIIYISLTKFLCRIKKS